MMLCAVVYASENAPAAVSADKDDARPWREAFEKAKEASATEAEVLADDVSLSIIRRHYGESSERLIAMLLIFDVFDLRKVMRQRFDMDECEERAPLFAQKRVLPLPSASSALTYKPVHLSLGQMECGSLSDCCLCLCQTGRFGSSSSA
eukprot:5356874-Pleurochrysis_carterae.AAC.2